MRALHSCNSWFLVVFVAITIQIQLLKFCIKCLSFSAKCIDHYTKLRVCNAEEGEEQKPIDSRLEAIVNRMFQRCFDDKQYKQVG